MTSNIYKLFWIESYQAQPKLTIVIHYYWPVWEAILKELKMWGYVRILVIWGIFLEELFGVHIHTQFVWVLDNEWFALSVKYKLN